GDAEAGGRDDANEGGGHPPKGPGPGEGGGAHHRFAVRRTGMENVAPWQASAAVADIEAAAGRWITASPWPKVPRPARVAALGGVNVTDEPEQPPAEAV